MMKKRFFFTCFLLLISFEVSSQTLNSNKDSLLRIWKDVSQTDTNRLKAIHQLASDLSVGANPDSAIVLAKQELLFAQKVSQKKYEGKALFSIGMSLHNEGKFSEALEYVLKALPICEETFTKKEIALLYWHIGNVYFRNANYVNSLAFFFKSLKIREEINDKQGIGFCYNNIGLVYLDQSMPEKALQYYLMALKIAEETNNKKWIAIGNNNIADIYRMQSNFTKALECQLKALKIWEELDSKMFLRGCNMNIADIYLDQRNFPKAIAYHKKAIELAKDLPNKSDLTLCYTRMSDTYNKFGNYKFAILYGDSALYTNKDFPNKDFERIAYSILASAYGKSGRYMQAYEYQLKYQTLNDSIFNDENSKQLGDIKTNFEVKKKEVELRADADVLLAKQKAQRNLYFGGAGLLMLASLLVFNRFRLKQKNRYQQHLNKQQKEQATAVMETQEQERKRIAEDLHDSLGHLLSTAKLNLQTVPDEQKYLFKNSLDLLNQASSEIHNISFNLMPQTLEEEGLIAALHELADKVRKTGSVNILLHVHGMEKVLMEKQTQFSLYRIIQEAINNIMKHAQANEINIQLVKQDDHITVMIEDDGKGFNPEEVKKDGRGLKNINTRSAWLNGTASIDSTPGRGTTVTIEAPLYN